MAGQGVKKVAIYARVSKDGQDEENQLRELKAVVEQRRWSLCEVFIDSAISGAKDRTGRPAFDALHRAATRGQVDIVMSWSVDRLGRSLKDLVLFLAELHALGVGLYLHEQALDTTTPVGKAMFGMCGVYAEFELSMMRARIRSGLARARSEGKRLGRPQVAPDIERQIVERLIQRGTDSKPGLMSIAREFNVGTGTVQRIWRAQGLPRPEGEPR